MAIEPVNERPIFPHLLRADANNLGLWSIGMIRQLTTVFQQYGYRLNRTMLAPGLTTNANELYQSGVYTLEIDAVGTPLASTPNIAVLHINTALVGEDPRGAIQMAFRSLDDNPMTWRRSRNNDATDLDDWGDWELLVGPGRTNVFTEEQVFWNTGSAGTIPNAFRIYNETADVAWIFRKDSQALYLLRSDTDETGENWDSARPMRVDDSTGGIEFGVTGVTEGVTVGEPSGGTRGKGSLSAETINSDGLLTVTKSLADDEIAIHLNLHRAWEIKRNGGTASSASLFVDSRANNPMEFGSENGNMRWLWVSNTGCLMGNPSGGTQGHGTLNAVAVYDDGTLLTDYVFDAELDGDIDVDAYDESTEEDELDEDGNVIGRRRRTHGPARNFKRNMSECNPGAFAAKWRQSRKLPAVERIAKKPSIGELTQALLETCEVQAIHIAKLEERISALEANNGSSTPEKPRSPTDSRD